jgi:hypothetical protein
MTTDKNTGGMLFCHPTGRRQVFIPESDLRSLRQFAIDARSAVVAAASNAQAKPLSAGLRTTP